MANVIAQRGDRIGWFDTDARHFTPASPGRAYQIKAARFAAARAALAGVVIVGCWPEPIGH